jgi:putative SOS response-associated peptidase YedK
MCGRYTNSRDEERRVESRFAERGIAEFTFSPRYNVAPTQRAPVLLVENDRLVEREMTWGFMPKWSKAPIINAKQETLGEKPTFRKAFAERRCLIPADGFYEWRSDGGRKMPVRFVLKSWKPFFFAGLWERYVRPVAEGETVVNDLDDEPPPTRTVDTFLIITTGANSVVWPVHDRMPVILQPTHYDWWLEPKPTVDMAAMALGHPCNDDLTCYPVSPVVNNARHENPDCIKGFPSS